MHGSQKVGGSASAFERASSRTPALAGSLSLIVGVLWTFEDRGRKESWISGSAMRRCIS